MINTLIQQQPADADEVQTDLPEALPDSEESAPLLSYKATVQDLDLWAERVLALRKKVQEIARAPNKSRQFRPMKIDEAAVLTGLPEWVCGEWATAHRQSNGQRAGGRGLTVEAMHKLMDERGVRPARPDGKRALRLLVSNFKGGAQKTTLALHMSQFLALRGYRVLVVDTDPQGTLTQYLGFRPSTIPNANTIGVVYTFGSSEDLEKAPQLEPIKTHIPGLDLLPANLDMTSTDFDVARLFVGHQELARRFPDRLDAALRSVEDDYDLILIDSPPAFSFFAIAMSWVADSLIVPMPTAAADFAGTGDFCEMLASYTRIVEEWYGRSKQWAPAIFVHARVAGGSGSDLVHTNSGIAFTHHRLRETVSDSRPIANCLGVFKSVFEATSQDTDSKGLERARDAYYDLCAKIESLLHEGWDCLSEVSHV